MYKVSVIIPVYNVEPYLKRCLDSVVNQTLEDIEIICINDCSTDNSLDILKEYAQNDKRIVLIDLPQNQGAAVARNKGLEIAKGEYLGFVDSDDAVDLNFYEELYIKALETGADIVKAKMYQYNTDGTIKERLLNEEIKEKGRFYFTYEWQTAIYKASLIFNNKIIFPPEIRKSQDIVFLNTALLKSKSLVLNENVNYYYYRRDDSLDADKISIDKIKISLMARQYITDNLNNSLGKDILPEGYITLYFNNIRTILNYIINKNDSLDAKKICMGKIVELYNECKMKSVLDKMFPPLSKDLLYFIKTGNVDELVNIFSTHKDMQLYFLSKIREDVKKDLSIKTNKEKL